ncbi:MAG: TonB family protein [Pseudomonadota bacterium]
MRVVFLYTPLLILSGIFHVSFFLNGAQDGSEAGGNDGETTVTLQSASAELIAALENWDKPFEVPTESPSLEIPAQAETLEIQNVSESNSIPSLLKPQLEFTKPLDAIIEPPKPERLVKEEKSKQRPAQQDSLGINQKARGEGQSNFDGSSTEEVTSNKISPKKRASLERQWGAQIRRQIERKKRRAKTRQRGTTIIAVRVARSGGLISAKIRKSSGNTQIDQTAMRIIKSANPFPTAPTELSHASVVFTVPVKF